MSPVSDSPSEKAMLMPAPSAVASPVKKAVNGRCVANTTAKIGASVESEPSISPLSPGWARCSRNSRSTAWMSKSVMIVDHEPAPRARRAPGSRRVAGSVVGR